MKIALLTSSFFPTRGGLEEHVLSLAKCCLREGGEPLVITLQRPGSPDGEVYQGVRVQRVRGLRELWQALRNFQPDVAHGHGARRPFVAAGILFSRAAQIPVAFTPHCFYPASGLASKLKKFLFDRTLGLASLRATDKIIALTENDKKDAVQRGAPGERITIIPNSLWAERAEPSAAALLRLEQYKPYVLFVGRLDMVKRADFLIEAFLEEGTRAQLVVIGADFGLRTTLKKQIEMNDAKHRVHLLGEVDEDTLLAAYAQCSAFALPSAYEGLPTVLLEAMSRGIPVIAADSGGTRYLVEDRVNGYLFPYADKAAFKLTLRALLESKTQDKKEVARNAKQTVETRFTWQANYPSIRSAYEAAERRRRVPKLRANCADS